jgi:hypothetical protein
VGNGLDSWFKSNVGWRLGDCKRIAFWEERWIDTMPLKIVFLSLFAFSMQQQRTISDIGAWHASEWR